MSISDVSFIGLVGNPAQGCPVCGDYHCSGCIEREEYNERRSCYDCQHHEEDFCTIFKKYIGELPGEVTAEDCGEWYA